MSAATAAEAARSDVSIERLNSDCFCLSLDRDALAHALDTEFGSPGPARLVHEKCLSVFAAQPVFVAATDLQRIAEVVRAIESVVALPAYRQQALAAAPAIARIDPGMPRGVFFGYDFHLDQGVTDVVVGSTSFVLLHGKGRKQRSLPLWKTTARDVRDWLRINGQLAAGSPLLPTRDGKAMTRANATQRLKRAVRAATDRHPELAQRPISPHLIRHSTAMRLLQSGAGPSEIALWLGHESPSTTHMYVEADLAMKERALARLKPPDPKPARYRPPKALMQFLQSL